MTENVPNSSSTLSQSPAEDVPLHPKLWASHHRGVVWTRAAFALAEDGKVVISFDERMEQDEMDAAYLALVEVIRTCCS
jgi:hypothetical protein